MVIWFAGVSVREVISSEALYPALGKPVKRGS